VVAFAMGSFSFRKEERIFRRAELLDLNIHGRRYYTKNFLVILNQNRRDITRLGITASKRVGNAVKRNRTKRLIREFFRLNKQQIPKGYDISIIALRVNDALNICKVQEELGDLLLKNDTPFS
jgi:ribonuclease P protein component